MGIVAKLVYLQRPIYNKLGKCSHQTQSILRPKCFQVPHLHYMNNFFYILSSKSDILNYSNSLLMALRKCLRNSDSIYDYINGNVIVWIALRVLMYYGLNKMVHRSVWITPRIVQGLLRPVLWMTGAVNKYICFANKKVFVSSCGFIAQAFQGALYHLYSWEHGDNTP